MINAGVPLNFSFCAIFLFLLIVTLNLSLDKSIINWLACSPDIKNIVENDLINLSNNFSIERLFENISNCNLKAINNDNIKDVVNLWCDNKFEEIIEYGHIRDWDVSNN